MSTPFGWGTRTNALPPQMLGASSAVGQAIAEQAASAVGGGPSPAGMEESKGSPAAPASTPSAAPVAATPAPSPAPAPKPPQRTPGGRKVSPPFGWESRHNATPPEMLHDGAAAMGVAMTAFQEEATSGRKPPRVPQPTGDRQHSPAPAPASTGSSARVGREASVSSGTRGSGGAGAGAGAGTGRVSTGHHPVAAKGYRSTPFGWGQRGNSTPPSGLSGSVTAAAVAEDAAARAGGATDSAGRGVGGSGEAAPSAACDRRPAPLVRVGQSASSPALRSMGVSGVATSSPLARGVGSSNASIGSVASSPGAAGRMRHAPTSSPLARRAAASSASPAPTPARVAATRTPGRLVALVRVEPLLFDIKATWDRLKSHIVAAAGAGAGLVAWGEGLLPGYPWWLMAKESEGDHMVSQGALFAKFSASCLTPDSPIVEEMRQTAVEHGVWLMGGVMLRAGSSCYSALITVTAGGRVTWSRKTKASVTERHVVADSTEGSPTAVFVPGLGSDGTGIRVGALLGDDNLRPALRAHLHSQHQHLHLALWACPQPHQELTCRFLALEGRSYVASISSVPDAASDAVCRRATKAAGFAETPGGSKCPQYGALALGPDGSGLGTLAGGSDDRRGVLLMEVDGKAALAAGHVFDYSGRDSARHIVRVVASS